MPKDYAKLTRPSEVQAAAEQAEQSQMAAQKRRWLGLGIVLAGVLAFVVWLAKLPPKDNTLEPNTSAVLSTLPASLPSAPSVKATKTRTDEATKHTSDTDSDQTPTMTAEEQEQRVAETLQAAVLSEEDRRLMNDEAAINSTLAKLAQESHDSTSEVTGDNNNTEVDGEALADPEKDYRFYQELPNAEQWRPNESPSQKSQTTHKAVLPNAKSRATQSTLNDARQSSATPTKKASAKKQYVLQIASFQNPRDAEQLILKLMADFPKVHQQMVNVKGRVWYRVLVGDFSDISVTQQVKNNLVDLGYSPLQLTR